MTSAMRWRVRAVLAATLWLAGSSLAADLATFMQDFGVAPTGRTPAPAFRLQTLDARTTTLADHGGRPVLLYFWATW
jgi:hypothetical protein